MAPTDPPKTNYFVLKTKAELSQDDEAKLNDIGVDIFTRLGSAAYLARYPSDKLDGVRKLAFVQKADVYPVVSKVHGNFGLHLPDVKFQPGPEPLAPVTVAAKNPNQVIPVVVALQPKPEQTAEQIIQQLSSILKPGKPHLSKDGSLFTATVAIKDLPQLIAIDSIKTLDLQLQPHIHGNLAREIIRAPVPTEADFRFKGAGQRIAVLDTGFDNGTIPAQNDQTSKFAGRILGLYDAKKGVEHPHIEGEYHDVRGHGTHVTGCIIGQGTWPEVVEITTDKEKKKVLTREDKLVQGTAPEAMVYCLRMALGDDEEGNLAPVNQGVQADPEETANIMQKGHDKGCRIVNNSWGSKGLYNAESESIDRWVLGKEVPNFPNTTDPVFVCWAVGNAGANVGSRALDVQPAAKNVLSVGASNSARPYIEGIDWKGAKATKYEAAFTRQMEDPEKMAGFSSTGPVYQQSGGGAATETRRIKPDVVAPGSLIVAPRSRAITNANRDKAFADAGNPLHDEWLVMSGTSMATPIVSGCIAVLRQILGTVHNMPSPACALRALVVNGARSLPRLTLRANWREQGFGRIDLRNSIDMLNPGVPGVPGDPQLHIDRFIKYGRGEKKPADAAEKDIHVLKNVKKGQWVRATLAWTDAPGIALQSTVHVAVISPDGPTGKITMYGNHWLPKDDEDDLKKGENKWEADEENNVQKVEWPVEADGDYTIRVTCIRIATGVAQVPFAVAWSVHDE